MTKQPYTLEKIQDIEAIDLSVIKEILRQTRPLPIWTFTWKNLIPEVDELAFMTTFTFPKLDELKASLKASGVYSNEQLDRIIAGLETLPEYRD